MNNFKGNIEFETEENKYRYRINAVTGEIISNEKIAKNVMQMIVKGDTSELKKPGQFINIEIEGLYLRRPISVCEFNKPRILCCLTNKGLINLDINNVKIVERTKVINATHIRSGE
mgnify:CR=1 FL=1